MIRICLLHLPCFFLHPHVFVFFSVLGELCRVLSYIKTLLLPNSTAEPSRVVAVFFCGQLLQLTFKVENLVKIGEQPRPWGKTQGRLTDFIDRGVITMANVGFLVLDEVTSGLFPTRAKLGKILKPEERMKDIEHHAIV